MAHTQIRAASACDDQRPPVGDAAAASAGDGLGRKVRRWFLSFLLLVLFLAVLLVVTGPGPFTAQDAATVAAAAGLAALAWYRHHRLTDSVVCDVGGVVLIFVVGLGITDYLLHLFGLAFVHLFLRTFDVHRARVVLNAVLHPLAYYAVIVAARGADALLRADTITNLVGFVFVAGLMHTLAKSILEQERLHEQIAHQATHDPLTGLPNRSLLMDRLAQALARARRHDTRMALVFIDLNDFKQVNDRHGHLVGDQLLAQWATRLHDCLRGSDTAARIGGDEFALIIEDVDTPDQARVAAQRIRAKLLEPFTVGDHTFRLDASCGIALSTPTSTPDDLLHHADTAMYAVKNTTATATTAGDHANAATDRRDQTTPAGPR
jgi:diguanylate cyclase (GGDEF)-like protein